MSARKSQHELRTWARHLLELDLYLVVGDRALVTAKTKDFSARGFGLVVPAGGDFPSEIAIRGPATASLLLEGQAIRIGGELIRSTHRSGLIEAGFVVPEILHPSAYGLMMRMAYTGQPQDFAQRAFRNTSVQNFGKLLNACETRFSERLLVEIEWAAHRGKPIESLFNTLVRLRAKRDSDTHLSLPPKFSRGVRTEAICQQLFEAFNDPQLNPKARDLLHQSAQEVAVENSVISCTA